jgi:PAS domain S-box-containing protein
MTARYGTRMCGKSASISKDCPHALMEFRIIDRSGQERWIEHQCQSVSSDTEEYRGRRGVNRDITERKRFPG